MLLDELIYEVGNSAFAAGVESDTERVMETDSGECTRLAVIQEDGETTTTAKDQLQLDRPGPGDGVHGRTSGFP